MLLCLRTFLFNVDNTKSQIDILKEFLYHNEDMNELDELSNRFNIFVALGITQQEIRHSNFLGWLLDPNETHGFGNAFLIRFLRLVTHD